MNTITKHPSVALGNFYKYLKDKDELFCTVLSLLIKRAERPDHADRRLRLFSRRRRNVSDVCQQFEDMDENKIQFLTGFVNRR